jgi:redox-sensitive bicupin YhaK (pirin superfamily)
MSSQKPSILGVQPLSFPWPTVDPFLFCAYHDDAYPAADANMAPAVSLAGRQLGSDFSRQDGWSLYHGHPIPGFPAHPHRGFETVTIVRRGLIDHSDSLGAAARFGQGDVQWLTAGEGIVHSEMFPLLSRETGNPLELFQIWLNLPARRKMVPPHFTMFWAHQVPHLSPAGVDVTVVAGALGGADAPLAPPPDSWAAQAEADVALWTLKLAPGAAWTLPPAQDSSRRMLYFFKGGQVRIAGQGLNQHAAVELRADAAVDLRNDGPEDAEFLMLQGRPIAEPVAQYGPFVMNTQAEIHQAMRDYQSTQFGGWPWPDPAPVHGREPVRFARHPDGRTEQPEACVAT